MSTSNTLPPLGVQILSCSVSSAAKAFVIEQAKTESEKNGYTVSVSNIVNRIILKAKKEYEEITSENKLI